MSPSSSLYSFAILAVAIPVLAAPQLIPGLPLPLPSLPLPSLPLPVLPLPTGTNPLPLPVLPLPTGTIPSLPIPLPPVLPPILPLPVPPKPTCTADQDGPLCCQSATEVGGGTLGGLLGTASGGGGLSDLPLDPGTLVQINCVSTTASICADGSAVVCCTKLPLDVVGVIGGLLPVGSPVGKIGLNCSKAPLV